MPVAPPASAACQTRRRRRSTSAQIYDHLHGTLALVRRIRQEVADLGSASVSVVSGAPKGQSRGRSTPAAVGRALRGAPASSGSRIA